MGESAVDDGWGWFRYEIRQIASPLGPEDLAPLDPRCTVVQFSAPLSDAEYRLLASFLDEYPHVRLRVYGDYRRLLPDLEFLRFFPNVKRFSVDTMYWIESLEGLRFLSEDLEDLTIGATKKAFSLRGLQRFSNLRVLYLERQQKDIGVIEGLADLEDLTLRSITLPDLSVLLQLRKLRSLDIKLGGTTNLGLLPGIGRLNYVELWMIRGLDNVSALGEVESLEHLYLQALKRVEHLPSFARLSKLTKVTLDTMKGLRDLSPVAAAPNLETLNLLAMAHLEPDALRPFAGHPSLRDAKLGLGSNLKWCQAYDILSLGEEPYNYAAYRERQVNRGARG